MKKRLWKKNWKSKTSKTSKKIGYAAGIAVVAAGNFIMGYIAGTANGERKKVERELDEHRSGSGRYPWQESDDEECA